MRTDFSSMNATCPRGLRASAAALAIAAAILAFGLLAFSAAPASATPAKGSFSMTLGSGSSGKALTKAGVRFSAVAPSTRMKLSGKRLKVTSPLAAVISAQDFTLRGGIRFSLGKRSIVARRMSVSTDPGRITARVAGKQIVLFHADVTPQVNETAATLKITGGKLRLTAGSARLIKSKLRLKGPRRLVSLVGGVDASIAFAFEDPFFAQCDFAATSLTVGTVPAAAPLPDLSASGISGGALGITWPFKTGFNGYISGIGLIQGFDGATVNGAPPAPPSGYTFPGQGGLWAQNGPGAADDQAILNGSGKVMFCNKAHGFRMTISNPTVVIDGASSRLIADIDTNIGGNWMPAQRVDLADLNLGAASIVANGGDITWTGIPATLSQTGADALRFCDVSIPGGPPGCLYPAGTVLSPLTITFGVA